MAKARAARGAPAYSPPPTREAPKIEFSDGPRDPFAAAQAALDKAQSTLGSHSRSRDIILREERAKAELAKLKAMRNKPSEDPPPSDDGNGNGNGGKKRSL